MVVEEFFILMLGLAPEGMTDDIYTAIKNVSKSGSWVLRAIY